MKYTQKQIEKLNDAFDEFLNGDSHDAAARFNDLQPTFYVSKGIDSNGSVYFTAMVSGSPISAQLPSLDEAIDALKTFNPEPQCLYDGDVAKFFEI